jgi:hypothetical protein
MEMPPGSPNIVRDPRERDPYGSRLRDSYRPSKALKWSENKGSFIDFCNLYS